MSDRQNYLLPKNHSYNFLLRISKRKAFRILVCVVVGFGLVNLATIVAQHSPDYPTRTLFIDIFSVDSEQSFPTLFSVLMLQVCSFLLAVIAYFTKLQKGRFLRHWQVLSLIFLYLSFDEALSLHERAINPIRSILGLGKGFLYYAWVIPAIILIAFFLIFYYRFIISLPNKIRTLFLISGSVFLSGSLLMEMISGHFANPTTSTNIAFSLIVACEEFLEMLGITIFIYALLSCLKMQLVNINISFD